MFARTFIIYFVTVSRLLSCLFFCSVSFGKSLTLNDYLSEVKQVNPALRSSALRADASRHKIAPAGSLEDPFIAVGVDEVPFEGGMGSVKRYQIRQAIPFPGKLSAKSLIAESRADSAKSDIETCTIISLV